MKSHLLNRLTLWLVCSCIATAAVGQEGVFFHVLRAEHSDTLQMQFETNAEGIKAWHDNYGPSLFAYPLKYQEILDVSKDYAMSFEETERVFLRMIVGDEALGTVRFSDKSGRELFRQKSTRDAQEYFIEIPSHTFGIQFDNMGADAIVSIQRVYLQPRPEQSTRGFGFDMALPCHINSVCTQADQWRDQTRSAVRIRMVLEEGIGWCSGTLINNTAMDGRPMILSAEHCLGNFTPIWEDWRFDFNYQSANCDNPADEPSRNSLTGCQPISKNRDTDFLLLDLEDAIPPAWQVYFAGWNRTPDYEPSPVALIHHPAGDIKKVSRDFQPIQLWSNAINWTEGYSTPSNTHFRARWDSGVFEPGSSGGGVFDTSGLVIGQLHGGTGDCNANFSYSGQFGVSWDYGDDSTVRLAEWLDPLGLDTMVFPGMEHPGLSDVYHLTLNVRDPQGRPLKNLNISVSGGIDLDVQTDSTGKVVLESLPRSQALNFVPSKNVNPKNGVSATDLLLIKKHLLGDPPFTENWQVLASDATGNQTVSASDILILQKLLLGLISQLPAQSSWIFDPPAYQILNPTDTELVLDFTAIKIGDVNGTVDPDQ